MAPPDLSRASKSEFGGFQLLVDTLVTKLCPWQNVGGEMSL